MLFRKKIERRCAYCLHAGKINNEQMACRKKGIVAAGGQCRGFRYDPLKRIPARAKPQDFSRYREQDFVL